MKKENLIKKMAKTIATAITADVVAIGDATDAILAVARDYAGTAKNIAIDTVAADIVEAIDSAIATVPALLTITDDTRANLAAAVIASKDAINLGVKKAEDIVLAAAEHGGERTIIARLAGIETAEELKSSFAEGGKGAIAYDALVADGIEEPTTAAEWRKAIANAPTEEVENALRDLRAAREAVAHGEKGERRISVLLLEAKEGNYLPLRAIRNKNGKPRRFSFFVPAANKLGEGMIPFGTKSILNLVIDFDDQYKIVEFVRAK